MRTLGVGLIGLLAVTATAHAQQAAGPQPWQQGMAAGMPESKLAPIAPPPLPTPADKLPLDKLKVKDGFKIEVYAAGVPNARTLRLGDKGTVFVSSRVQDKVHALVTRDGKREMKVIASGLHRPNGIALHNGTLYIAELSQISKIDRIEDNLDNPPKPTVILDGLPKDEPHGWKYLTVGPDEKLYFQVGAPCNICIPSDRHTKIYRVGLDGKNLEVYAQGIRQIVGMDWHPTLKQLYFSENSRDWLSEDVPEDKLNRVTQPGKDNFGFPYCHQGTFTDPEFGWGHSCKEFTPPVALLGPHSAALGIKFNTGNGLGDDYRGALFLARHGSWNRTVKVGGDVVAIKLNDDGTFKSMEPFVTGFIQNNNYVGRPVDVLPMTDGSLLVSDDFNGAVYRVSRAQ
jgi:glucose/arabinose dehydrogenase